MPYAVNSDQLTKLLMSLGFRLTDTAKDKRHNVTFWLHTCGLVASIDEWFSWNDVYELNNFRVSCALDAAPDVLLQGFEYGGGTFYRSSNPIDCDFQGTFVSAILSRSILEFGEMLRTLISHTVKSSDRELWHPIYETFVKFKID
jgi:hypothetical protein